MTVEQRVTSPTGGSKGTKEERYDLIPVPALAALARLFGHGAGKYEQVNGRDNWRNGYPWSLSYAALQRHLNAFWRGEEFDKEGFPHLAAVMWHAMVLYTFSHGEEYQRYDDRQDKPRKSPLELLLEKWKWEPKTYTYEFPLSSFSPELLRLYFGGDYLRDAPIKPSESDKIIDASVIRSLYEDPRSSSLYSYPLELRRSNGRWEILTREGEWMQLPAPSTDKVAEQVHDQVANTHPTRVEYGHLARAATGSVVRVKHETTGDVSRFEKEGPGNWHEIGGAGRRFTAAGLMATFDEIEFV